MAAIKVLLIEDVEDLGRSGEVVSVKPGYARNKLIPCGAAVAADKSALRMQARLQEERAKKAIQDKEEAEKLKAQIEAFEGLVTVVKVDHEGHMYGSVSANDIVVLLEQQATIHVEKRTLLLKHAIKETGEHIIPLKLNEGVTAEVKLTIEPEQAAGAASAKKV
jgi:large subunit ribosomal protein L9